jgi:hypothetical protein
MRPLFQAIRKQEKVAMRPFGNRDPRLQPLLRVAFWGNVWGSRTPAELQEWRDRMASLVRQAPALPPLDAPRLTKLCHQGPRKAGGIDGIDYAFLRSLPVEALSAIGSCFESWEAQGCLPQQLQAVWVVLLPKSDQIERPIGLTHVLWRIWAKVRWQPILDWISQYSPVAVWDSALPGRSCLDIAIKRLIVAEGARRHNHCFVSLFADLTQYYEHVDQHKLLEEALRLNFPQQHIGLALQVYSAPRYIDVEGILCPPVRPGKGIVAGCPLAPILAKIPLYPTLSRISASPKVSNIDSWIDDVSIDVMSRDPAEAAFHSVEAYRRLRQGVEGQGLILSGAKTVFVASDAKTEACLKAFLKPGEPSVVQVTKDLGVDSSGGRRRRTVHQQKRMTAGGGRSRRVSTLGLPGRTRLRVVRSSVVSVATWGHQAQGVSPKHQRWLRHIIASSLGKHKMGSSDFTLAMFRRKVADPGIELVVQHLRTVLPILASMDVTEPAFLRRTWGLTYARLCAATHRWKLVAGPLAALQAYLMDCRIGCESLDRWQVNGKDVCPLACQGRRFRIQDEVRAWMQSLRFQRIASHQGGGRGGGHRLSYPPPP